MTKLIDNVPMPKSPLELVGDLEVGQSIPVTESYRGQLLSRAKKKYPGKNFTTRKMEDGTYRLFRINDSDQNRLAV